jgi:hypothetical protein
MSEFIGNGWKMGHAPDGMRAERLKYRTEDGEWVAFHRPEPVPPLPTEQNTVIEVTWRDDLPLLVNRLVLMGEWRLVGSQRVFETNDLASRITDWKPLSVPMSTVGEVTIVAREQARKETARAVLDRVRAYLGMADDDGLRNIEEDFR